MNQEGKHPTMTTTVLVLDEAQNGSTPEPEPQNEDDSHPIGDAEKPDAVGDDGHGDDFAPPHEPEEGRDGTVTEPPQPVGIEVLSYDNVF